MVEESDDMSELFREYEDRQRAQKAKAKGGKTFDKLGYFKFDDGQPVQLRIVTMPGQKPYVKYQQSYIGKLNWPGFNNKSPKFGKLNHFVCHYEGDDNPVSACRLDILNMRNQHERGSPEYEKLDTLWFTSRPTDVYDLIAIDRRDGKLKRLQCNPKLFMDYIVATSKKKGHGIPWLNSGGWDMEIEKKGKGAWSVTKIDHSDLTPEELKMMENTNYSLDSYKTMATPKFYGIIGVSYTSKPSTEEVADNESKMERLDQSDVEIEFDLETPF